MSRTFRRNKQLNDLLMSKRGEVHDAKEGKHIKRARAKQKFLRELKRAA